MALRDSRGRFLPKGGAPAGGGGFGADMAAFAKKYKLTLDETHRGVVIELFSSVIMDTPVDEGQLRGAWNVSQDKPNHTAHGKKDKSGAGAISKVVANPGKAGSVTYLTNPLPYAEVAEYGQWGTGNADAPDSKVTPQGYSKKAPAGMVRRNVARVHSIVAKAAGRAKGKKS